LSGLGNNTGAGVMMEADDPGMETQEVLSACPSPQALLLSLLWPWRSVCLQGDVGAACRGDRLLVVDVSSAQEHSNRGPVAAEPISMDDLWGIVFAQ
jgi:hypothetical protein